MPHSFQKFLLHSRAFKGRCAVCGTECTDPVCSACSDKMSAAKKDRGLNLLPAERDLRAGPTEAERECRKRAAESEESERKRAAAAAALAGASSMSSLASRTSSKDPAASSLASDAAFGAWDAAAATRMQEIVTAYSSSVSDLESELAEVTAERDRAVYELEEYKKHYDQSFAVSSNALHAQYQASVQTMQTTFDTTVATIKARHAEELAKFHAGASAQIQQTAAAVTSQMSNDVSAAIRQKEAYKKAYTDVIAKVPGAAAAVGGPEASTIVGVYPFEYSPKYTAEGESVAVAWRFDPSKPEEVDWWNAVVVKSPLEAGLKIMTVPGGSSTTVDIVNPDGTAKARVETNGISLFDLPKHARFVMGPCDPIMYIFDLSPDNLRWDNERPPPGLEFPTKTWWRPTIPAAVP